MCRRSPSASSPSEARGSAVTRLPPLDPAVAETRVAVRLALGALASDHAVPPTAGAPGDVAGPTENRGTEPVAADPGSRAPLVLVALSGGADSLALAAAIAFEAPRAGVGVGALIVDHGLQEDSAEVAARAAEQARGLGLEPVLVRRVEIPREGSSDGDRRAGPNSGPETGAAMMLTAHTRDDQAEQVLLALARGSGTRAIAGIPRVRDRIFRPFLEVSRRTTEAACRAQGLEPWRDPHNADPAYTRVRVRERVLPVLEAELGPGIAANLARSAELAREDADALDEMARLQLGQLAPSAWPGTTMELPILELSMQHAALRQRIIRTAARERFGSHLSREHTLAIAALVTEWRGQGPVYAPGLRVTRRGDALVFERQLGSPRSS
ncbi:MAG: tRNA lysidine(34) synthetase TilS [Candidatus Leucobacter sulfamidivorax]|nr:tRNA lysidine(34) synthetase TilS [Candidatus Leucobacter sulfamidivorax]